MGKAWDTWMLELADKAEKTKANYTSYFKRFLKRWNVTAEEIYEMRRSDLASEDTRDHKRVERMIKAQMAEMKKKDYSASTRRMLAKSAVSFFEAQDLPLKLKPKDMPRGRANGQFIALPDVIREMWENAPYQNKLRNKAIILFCKDSGLRCSDLGIIKVGDYEDAETERNEKGEAFKAFEMETVKMEIEAFVHVGPETVDAVDAYLQERRDKGAALTPDSPLFTTYDGKGPMTGAAIGHVLMRMSNRLGKKGRRISAHSLRKSHTTLLESVMPRSWVMKLQGKAVGPYSQPELMPGELMRAYMAGYDRIRVFTPSAGVDEVERLKKRIVELESSREGEAEALHKRIEALEAVVGRVSKTMIARGDKLSEAHVAMTGHAELDHMLLAMSPEAREEFLKIYGKLREDA